MILRRRCGRLFPLKWMVYENRRRLWKSWNNSLVGSSPERKLIVSIHWCLHMPSKPDFSVSTPMILVLRKAHVREKHYVTKRGTPVHVRAYDGRRSLAKPKPLRRYVMLWASHLLDQAHDLSTTSPNDEHLEAFQQHITDLTFARDPERFHQPIADRARQSVWALADVMQHWTAREGREVTVMIDNRTGQLR